MGSSSDQLPRRSAESEALRPSIKDVARQSGVSYKTVSRVVNGEANVSDATRLRVETAIGALGYRPDHSARSLRRGRTQAIRLLLVRRHERLLTEPFLDEMVTGIVDSAAAAGYAVVLEAIGSVVAASAGPRFDERRVDGTILLDGRLGSPLVALLRETTPWVVVTAHSPDPAAGWVYADFRGGARQLVEHLLDLGHVRIAHLTGHLTHSELDRLRGYRQALKQAGIRMDPALVTSAGHLRHHGYAATEKLLAGHGDFTAIFAVNDVTALGAIDCLRQHGRRVPDDVSVVGFDDIYLAPHANPPLTTVRVPAYAMGAAATELLIGAVEGRRPFPNGCDFPIEMSIRESTAPPPKAR